MRKKVIFICMIFTMSIIAFSAEASPKRIISLSPVGTEILYDLGQEKNIVGVTTFCDYPPAARKKPKVGGYAGLNLETLIARKIDLLILSDIHMSFTPQLDKLGIKYAVIHQDNINDAYKSIEAVGAACGQKKRAEAMVKKLKTDIGAITNKTRGLKRPKVVLSVSRELSDPHITMFYSAGRRTFYNDLIEMAGGENAVTTTRSMYQRVSQEGLIQLDPDVIIDIVGERTFYHATGPIDVNKIFNKKYLTKQWLECRDVKAAKNGRVYVLDGTVYLRPGPRMAVILKSFAKAIHPEIKF